MMRAFVLLSLAVLGACTPMRWEHPQYGLAGAQEDYAACNQSARAEAWRYQMSAKVWEPPRYYRDRDGRVIYDPWGSSRRYDPWMDEARLADYCMRNKGYRLVPVPKEPPG